MKKVLALFTILVVALILIAVLTIYNRDNDSVKNNNINLANNVTTETVFGADGSLIVLVNNKNSSNVKLQIEVHFYDEEQDITDIETDTVYMSANSEFAYEISEVYNEQKVSKISVKAEEDKINFQTTDLTISNETQTEETLNFKVKNNSTEKLEYMTAVVVFYKDGQIIDLNKTGETNVESGSSAEMLAPFPTDSNFDKVEFDDYKIYAHGITYKK